ncbi:MAG: metal-dependent hydrolase [Alphaproteobacteria bacterium]|nr:metal-dependent hydrolase [Alphaproteobacteria bacterium]
MATPHPVTPRNLELGKLGDGTRYWLGGDPARTAFMNGLSITFPEGERMFVDSVKPYREAIADERLAADVRGFCGQEAIHAREHATFNDRLTEQGFPVGELEDKIKARIAWVKAHFPQRHRLAVTCALEHFTAIMANQILSHPEYFEDADEEYRKLWLWHALEETEHKAVAFDVYRNVAGGTYFERVRVMILMTIMFNLRIFNHVRVLLKTDGLAGNLKLWAGLLWYLWGKPGFFRRCAKDYLDYFRPGFHPWDHDNGALAESWKRRFEPPRAPLGAAAE